MQSELLFRLLYNSFFILLTTVLVGLLVITPADAIRQALNNNQLYNVFVVAGCYLLTFILASLIYASRLYTNRTILAAIPKTFIPVEKEDVGKGVRKMIAESLNRSALIAYEARPRIPIKGAADEEAMDVAVPENAAQENAQDHAEDRPGKQKSDSTGNTALSINIPSLHPPVWGEISHPGWSSPLSGDLPNLQYVTVIQELPNLIEAKAVSLAPTDPSIEPPMPDLRAIDLLQRPATQGLREYVSKLINLAVITDPLLTNEFIKCYEYARFSTEPLTEHEFRHLMKLFADLLRNMTSLDPTIFDNDSQSSMINESDIDDDASSKSTPVTPRSRSLRSIVTSRSVSRSGSEGTIRTAPSRRHGSSQTNPDSMSIHAAGSRSIPGTPQAKLRGGLLSMTKMPSASSIAPTSRVPYARSQRSSASLRSSSTRSGSGGSVIRLNLNGGELPYVIG